MRLPNGTELNGTDPWWIKGFGSKFAFVAWITNFGQNIMYPYAEQKGMANIKISLSSHGSGFSNSWQHYEVLPGTHTRLSETIYFVEGKDSSLRYYMKYLIDIYHTEIPLNLLGQFSLSGQIFFALGSSNLEGACGISK